ncbi:hypothetical protein IE5_04275 [Bacillus cereus BAG3X2-2]|uniref:DUF2726 domain-containing protein n=1 Tax=Bacillus cereus TaxID=1396 RepID=UPI0002792B4C|nr:DUF2726 domain-containing protein [Bacillus cereus]EJQ18406.1 hypothetical protein IE5_04275 [Bacillus cereus BAG3X2-2]PFJ64428.1 DUF2726 domain-containing protein [Bacillus cereus]
MPRKKTFEEVKQAFDARDYRLLETEYKGQLFKMKFVCPNHTDKDTEITYKQLVRGEGCKYCGIEKVAKAVAKAKRKYSVEDVKRALIRNGCELLDMGTSYRNAKEPIHYRCKCGKVCKTNFQNYKRGSGLCKSCIIKQRPLKWTYEEISKEFERKGCILLSREIHTLKKLSYICICGNKGKVTLSNFRRGNRCKECAIKRLRNNYEDVKRTFEENGCTLLTKKYKSSTFQKLDYICSCGNHHSIRFLSFQRGERCPQCSSISKGEKAILHFLEMNSVQHKYQFTIKKCKNINPLPFDFVVFDEAKSIKCLIEFDGKHHFTPIKEWGGDKYFERVKKNDKIKNEYCHTNDIPLYRISYKELRNVKAILTEILLKNNEKFINKYLTKVNS